MIVNTEQARNSGHHATFGLNIGGNLGKISTGFVELENDVEGGRHSSTDRCTIPDNMPVCKAQFSSHTDCVECNLKPSADFLIGN